MAEIIEIRDRLFSKRLQDIFIKIKTRGYVIESDEKELLKACEKFVGFPVTMQQLKDVIDVIGREMSLSVKGNC